MGRSFTAIAALTLLAVVACAGDGASPGASSGPSPSPDAATLEPSLDPVPSVDPEGELCLRVGDIQDRLAALRAVELQLPNRVALEIELDKLISAYVELKNSDFGASEDRLEGSLKRLGYRLGELELAVEDFRTNSRPRRAAPHVEEEAEKVADELGALVILSRC